MSIDIFTGSLSTYNGYVYAANNGSSISQNSWGYGSAGSYNQTDLNGIDYFAANGGGTALSGGLVIFAAGNDNSNANWYPGFYSTTMAVASTDNADKKSSFSNYGTWVEISAPGSSIYSTYGSGNSVYGNMSGTSMACPHVTGVAAALIAFADGVATANDLRDLLKKTATNIDGLNPSYQGQLGAGRVYFAAAAQEVLDEWVPEEPPVCDFIASKTSILAGETITFSDKSTKMPRQWAWNFTANGYPATSTTKNPQVTFVDAGTYTISLTVTNPYGSNSKTRTNYITVTTPTPPAQNPKIVGTGNNGNTSRPLGFDNRYQMSAAIYLASEIQGQGIIDQLAWYTQTARAGRPLTLYMKHTSATTLTAVSWNDLVDGATSVFNGTISNNTNEWTLIDLTTKFAYNGTDNLMVLGFVNSNAAPPGSSAIRYTTSTNRNWIKNGLGTGTPLNPYRADFTGVGTVDSNRPNIHLRFMTVVPPVADFGFPNQVYSEGFETVTESGYLPTGWEQWRTTTLGANPYTGTNVTTDTANPRWFRNSSSYGFADYTPYIKSGEASMATGYTTPNFTTAISPNIVLPNVNGLNLEYWVWYHNGQGWPTNYHVKVYDVAANTWTLLQSFIGCADCDNLMEHPEVFSLAAFKNKTIRIAFVYEYVDGWQMGIDDISITDGTVSYNKSVPEGEPIQIFDLSTGNPIVWDWTTNGAVNPKSAVKDPLFTYNVAGNYNVTLKAGTLAGSNTRTRNNVVTVFGRVPIAEFKGEGGFRNTAFGPFVKAGQTANYTDLTTRVPTSWNWSFPGGTPATSTTKNPSGVAYATNGTYDVTLTSTNATGNNTITKTGYVKVGGTSGVTGLLPGDNLTWYNFAATNGFLPGHGRIMEGTTTRIRTLAYANYFPMPAGYEVDITAVNIAVAKAVGVGKNIIVRVWDGTSGAPGAILASKTMAITSFTVDQWNTVVFDAPVTVSSNFFIGYELQYDGTHNYDTHQFTAYMAQGRSILDHNAWVYAYWNYTGYVGNYWDPIDDVFEISSSLAVNPVVTIIEGSTLTLVSNPTDGGTVTNNTGGGPRYNLGDIINVTAVANTGYAFTNWTVGGTTVSTNPTFNFTMPGVATTLTANFTKVCLKPDYTQNLQTASVPTFWTQSGTPTWVVGTIADVGLAAGQGNYAYANYSGTAAQGGQIISDCFDFSTHKDIKISMHHRFYLQAAGQGSAFLEYSINGGTWTQIATWTVTMGAGAVWTSPTIPALEGKSNVQFRWRVAYNSHGNPARQKTWSVDNIIVTGTPITALLGDVNGDGNIDVLDVVWMVSHLNGSTPVGFVMEAADVTSNGSIDVGDLTAIINIILNISKSSLSDVNDNIGYIHLNENGIVTLKSDGNLTAIQFRFDNINYIQSIEKMINTDHNLVYNMETGRGLIYSLSNKLIPSGNIDIFRVNGDVNNINWSKDGILGANNKTIQIKTSKFFNINIYPNPTAGNFNINFNLPLKSDINMNYTPDKY